jgi:oligo-alginate lyase
MDEKIELPSRGSNWFHWYVCPRHGVRLSTGKRIGPWQWEHVCPAGKEIIRGDPSRPERDFDGCALSATHERYARAIRDGGLLFQVTGQQRYARRAREILLAYAARYLDYPLHNTAAQPRIGGGRVGPQTLDEAVWLIPVAQGADLIWDTLSETDRQTLAEKLFLRVGVRVPDKQGNNRKGFVAVVGLNVWNVVQYQGCIRP